MMKLQKQIFPSTSRIYQSNVPNGISCTQIFRVLLVDHHKKNMKGKARHLEKEDRNKDKDSGYNGTYLLFEKKRNF